MKVQSCWSREFGERPAQSSIDTVVLHTMYHPEDNDYFCPQKCKQWLDRCGVSSHYIIDRSGGIWQTVLEKDMAWHAGASEMPFADDNRTAVNHFSIGIELIATETSGIDHCQYESLAWLVNDIRQRHTITAIVGHDEIAPGRKSDPWGFDYDLFQERLDANATTGLVGYRMMGHSTSIA